MPKVTGKSSDNPKGFFQSGEYDGISPATRKLLLTSSTKERAYLGVDPGSQGGMTIISKQGKIKGLLPFGNSTAHQISDWLSTMGNTFDLRAALERVHSMPKQGVASSFAFGKATGLVEGMLVAHKIPYIEVTPQKWQKFFSIQPRGEKTKTQHKRLLQAKAHKIYPAYVKEITLSVADSVLIAEWLRCDLTVLSRDTARVLGMENE